MRATRRDGWVAACVAFGVQMSVAGLVAQDDVGSEELPPLTVDGRIEEAQGRFAFPNVTAWKLVDVESLPTKEERRAAFVVWKFRARTFRFGDVQVAFVLLNGAPPSPRLQAIYERREALSPELREDARYDIALDPIVHACRPTKDGTRRDLFVYLPANGRILTVRFTVMPEHLERARPVLLRFAQQVEVRDLPTWPRRPDGYEYEEQSGIGIGFDGDVSKQRRVAIHKLVRDTVADFTKEHGAPWLHEGAPVRLIVTADAAARRELSAAEQPREFESYVGGRLMACPVFDVGDGAAVGSFRAILTDYLSATLYPEHDCFWLHWGLRTLAEAEGMCGKALPRVPKSYHGDMVRVTKGVGELVAAGRDFTSAEAAAMIAFFRLAPRKYRGPFEDLLEELRTGCAPGPAVKAFVDRFEPIKLRKAARKLLTRKLKPMKDS